MFFSSKKRRRTKENQNHHEEVKETSSSPAVKQAIERFKKASKVELKKLFKEGLDFHTALNRLIDKLRSQHISFRASTKDIEFVQELSGFNLQSAIHVLITREELLKLQRNGYSLSEAIDQLILRIQGQTNQQKRHLQDFTQNEFLSEENGHQSKRIKTIHTLNPKPPKKRKYSEVRVIHSSVSSPLDNHLNTDDVDDDVVDDDDDDKNTSENELSRSPKLKRHHWYPWNSLEEDTATLSRYQKSERSLQNPTSLYPLDSAELLFGSDDSLTHSIEDESAQLSTPSVMFNKISNEEYQRSDSDSDHVIHSPRNDSLNHLKESNRRHHHEKEHLLSPPRPHSEELDFLHDFEFVSSDDLPPHSRTSLQDNNLTTTETNDHDENYFSLSFPLIQNNTNNTSSQPLPIENLLLSLRYPSSSSSSSRSSSLLQILQHTQHTSHHRSQRSSSAHFSLSPSLESTSHNTNSQETNSICSSNAEAVVSQMLEPFKFSEETNLLRQNSTTKFENEEHISTDTFSTHSDEADEYIHYNNNNNNNNNDENERENEEHGTSQTSRKRTLENSDDSDRVMKRLHTSSSNKSDK
jgi:hypothetical protein